MKRMAKQVWQKWRLVSFFVVVCCLLPRWLTASQLCWIRLPRSNSCWERQIRIEQPEPPTWMKDRPEAIACLRCNWQATMRPRARRQQVSSTWLTWLAPRDCPCRAPRVIDCVKHKPSTKASVVWETWFMRLSTTKKAVIFHTETLNWPGCFETRWAATAKHWCLSTCLHWWSILERVCVHWDLPPR